MFCEECGCEYDRISRKNKPGKITVCEDCADDVEKYTGNMIYGHKCGSELQINSDSRLTQYINNTTKLKNKGSNMGDNVIQASKNARIAKTQGACVKVADAVDYKNKNI